MDGSDSAASEPHRERPRLCGAGGRVARRRGRRRDHRQLARGASALTAGAAVSAVDWLVESDEPGIAAQAKCDLLDEPKPSDAASVLDGPKVRALLAGQQSDGGFGVNVYAKWGGAHWRLVSLVELGVPPGEPRCLAAVETVLGWLTGKAHRQRIQVIGGLTRRCASQEGNALAVCCRLGLADDPRVRLLAESLVEWQWPDGGWNCDKKSTGYRSSFNESLAPMWGLHEYWAATGEVTARDTARRTAELFLDHRIFRRLASGEPIHESFATLHSPPFWHYDYLQALVVLARMGLAGDARAEDGLDLLEERRLPDGRWSAGGRWWKAPGSNGANVEVVDWGSGPNELLTLHALRVLRAAGRSRS